MSAGCSAGCNDTGCFGGCKPRQTEGSMEYAETHDGKKLLVPLGTPPRPDERWVTGEGRRLHDPKFTPEYLPAPPRVAVEVPGDIADDVREYARRRDMEQATRRRVL